MKTDYELCRFILWYIVAFTDEKRLTYFEEINRWTINSYPGFDKLHKIFYVRVAQIKSKERT